ncbi:hypothetical protein [Bradyrhizobium guangzhouense]|uniref:Uncharacterized protein n=1 Tax=Bradyrhizobium guangzhouense TaxID=1325095 RepID=A0AAE5X6G3_9BRAD|nr:hypothetical protein [Bradyrhizobium guangzhouense]QAU49682.1 hypothetical protein XH91_32825 [Bradyrhizobium guangzhouense]
MNSHRALSAILFILGSWATQAHSEERVARLSIVGGAQPLHWQRFSNSGEIAWASGFPKPADPIFVVYTSEETRQLVQGKFDLLSNEIASLRTRLDQQERLIAEVRDQLLKKIGDLPLALARDEQAYALLQQRLKSDLASTFVRAQ